MVKSSAAHVLASSTEKLCWEKTEENVSFYDVACAQAA